MARRLTVTAGLAFVAVLVASCGGGAADSAKVEAALRDWFGTVRPDETSFPQGAGVVPRVTTNSCKELAAGSSTSRPSRAVRLPKGRAIWTCVVRFGKVPMHAVVDVYNNTKVVDARPALDLDLPPSTVTLPPARTYTSP